MKKIMEREYDSWTLDKLWVYQDGRYVQREPQSEEEEFVLEVAKKAWGLKSRKKTQIFSDYFNVIKVETGIVGVFFPFGVWKRKDGSYVYSWNPEGKKRVSIHFTVEKDVGEGVRRKKFTESVDVKLCDKYYEMGYVMGNDHSVFKVVDDDMWVLDEYSKDEWDVGAMEIAAEWIETGAWDMEVWSEIEWDIEKFIQGREDEFDERDIEELQDKLTQCWADGWVDAFLEKARKFKLRR